MIRGSNSVRGFSSRINSICNDYCRLSFTREIFHRKRWVTEAQRAAALCRRMRPTGAGESSSGRGTGTGRADSASLLILMQRLPSYLVGYFSESFHVLPISLFHSFCHRRSGAEPEMISSYSSSTALAEIYVRATALRLACRYG